MLILAGSVLLLYSVCLYFLYGQPNKSAFNSQDESEKAKKNRTTALRLCALGILLILFQTLTI